MKIYLSLLFSILTIFGFSQISFTESTSSTFTGINNGDVTFADVDGDGDPDVLVIGYGENFSDEAQLYKNDGTGQFSPADSGISGLGYSSMDFADVDNDGDLDLLIAGQSSASVSTRLYLNDGTGDFTLSNNSSFQSITFSNVGFADVDGDDDPDILISGINETLSAAVTALYINDGFGNFNLSSTSLPKVYQGDFDFADIDGDDDLDLLLTGTHPPTFMERSFLLTNNGNGSFTEVFGTPFIDVNISSVNFEDIDNDGDPDVLITGGTSFGFASALYKNDGAGVFTEVNNAGITNVLFSDAAFMDFDFDDDPDLVVVGRKGPIPDESAKVYSNDGDGNFTEVTGLNLTGATGGGVDVADVDGDGHADLFIAGIAPDENLYSKLYINDNMINDVESIDFFQTSVYPNPFNDFLNLEFGTALQYISLELSNAAGQVIKNDFHQNVSAISIPTTKLPKGIYFLNIKNTNGEQKTIRIVKS